MTNEKKKLTLDAVMKDKDVLLLVNQANKCLEVIGYTDHGPRHVGYVSKIAGRILEELGYNEHRIELAKVAGWMHDIGNMINRYNHGITGASMIFEILKDKGYELQDICEVCSAVGSHEENYGKPISDVSAALIIADKVDAYKARVRAGKFDATDIHDRVNFAIKNTSVEVDNVNKRITFDFTMDNSSSIMEFLDIYMSRIKMCEDAAKFLGCTFVLKTNGAHVNNTIFAKR